MRLALMCAREAAADYRNGPLAARFAVGYLVLVGALLLATLALVAGGALSGTPTLAAVVATLPGSAVVVGGLSSIESRPGAEGIAGWSFQTVEMLALLAVGVGQAWLLWRVGRGARLS